MARSPQTKPPSKKRTPNATRAKYPRHSVERALRIPKAILDQNAGKPVTPEEAAVLLGVTTAKGGNKSELQLTNSVLVQKTEICTEDLEELR
jgi:hypothetical protein